MYQLRQTEVFFNWLSRLKDRSAKARILVRLESARQGHLGDTKSLGAGLHEMRVHFGPGYRMYYTRKAGLVVLLLCGGSKATQGKDIARARRIMAQLDQG
jgi:putative addiction module killer protein